MKVFTTIILLLTVAIAGIVSTGCPQRVNIAEIERNPGKYQDKEVVIAGVVRDSYGISIPGTRYGGGAYRIDDGTGSIWVLVTDGSVPLKGAEIGVKGRVSNGIRWKGRNYGLGLHEEDRRYRKR